MALDESNNPSGRVVETGGIKFIIDPDQSAFFENVKLDYKKSFLGFDEFKLVKA